MRISNGAERDSAQVKVVFDPRLDIPLSDMQARNALIERLMAEVKVATEAADRLRAAKKTIKAIDERIKEREDEQAKQVKERGKALQDSLKALSELLFPKKVQGIRTDPTVVSARLNRAFSYLRSSWEAPKETEQLIVKQAETALKEVVSKVNAFFAEQWAAYRQLVEQAGVSFFEPYEPLRVGE
ncbi:MAG: hypothetical protein D6743_15110 [Calditrichaeota bacterium]|nr:MAG: hypothetical protein D6743_15110 [Calditrichota bacterium]